MECVARILLAVMNMQGLLYVIFRIFKVDSCWCVVHTGFSVGGDGLLKRSCIPTEHSNEILIRIVTAQSHYSFVQIKYL